MNSVMKCLAVSIRCKRSEYLPQHCLHEKTCAQQRFTILEVAADWHEPVVPRHIMCPSTVRDSEELDPRCSITDIPPHHSHSRPSLRTERQSAWMSKITNDGLTRSGTGCIIAVPVWQQ